MVRKVDPTIDIIMQTKFHKSFLALYGLHVVRWLIAQMTCYKSSDPSIVAKIFVSELSQPPH